MATTKGKKVTRHSASPKAKTKTKTSIARASKVKAKTTASKTIASVVVKKELPGWKIVSHAAALRQKQNQLSDSGVASSVVVSSSIEKMLSKFKGLLGGDSHADSDAQNADAAEKNAKLMTEVVTVESPSGVQKTLGIRDGKVAWRQG